MTAQRQIPKKWFVKKYFSCDRAYNIFWGSIQGSTKFIFSMVNFRKSVLCKKRRPPSANTQKSTPFRAIFRNMLFHMP